MKDKNNLTSYKKYIAESESLDQEIIWSEVNFKTSFSLHQQLKYDKLSQ